MEGNSTQLFRNNIFNHFHFRNWYKLIPYYVLQCKVPSQKQTEKINYKFKNIDNIFSRKKAKLNEW